jgi:hypothetical protein
MVLEENTEGNRHDEIRERVHRHDTKYTMHSTKNLVRLIKNEKFSFGKDTNKRH